MDDCVIEEEINVNLKGLSDIKEESNGNLFEEYYSKDDCVSKAGWQNFKIPKRMDDYKCGLGHTLLLNKISRMVLEHVKYTLVGT